MSSVREQVLADFFAALGNIDPDAADPVAHPVAGVHLLRNYDIEVQEFPAVVQFDGGFEIAQDEDAGRDKYTQRLELECYVQAATPGELHVAMDALFVAICEAVLSDYTRGGKAQDTRLTGMEDPIIERAEGQGPSAGFLLMFEIDFYTRTNDPVTA